MRIRSEFYKAFTSERREAKRALPTCDIECLAAEDVVTLTAGLTKARRVASHVPPGTRIHHGPDAGPAAEPWNGERAAASVDVWPQGLDTT